MASSTTNLGLRKPDGSDNWSVANDFNANMDKIDAAYPPRRPVYKTISATSQSALDSALAEECASLAYGNFEVIELLGNWSGGTSPTSGARSLATLHRLNLSGNYYMCYVHFTGATGYYYSGAWHWDLGLPAINSQLAVVRGNYTPTIGATSGTGFAVGNVNFVYHKYGSLLYVSGRFQVTGQNSPNSSITISLPSGMSCYNMGVGSCGHVALNKAYSGIGLSIRTDGGNVVYIQEGAGGYCTSSIGTTYVIVDFMVFLQ